MSSNMIKGLSGPKTNWATCTNCQSLADVLCRSAQCYSCFKSRILRIFKQTFRTKIISKINSLIIESKNRMNRPSEGETREENFINGSKMGKKTLKIGIACSDPKYGLGRGIYASKLLLHLLLLRNAHRKRLFDHFPDNINDADLTNLLVTDDIEIVGFYIIDDGEFCNIRDELINSKVPIHRIHVRNPNVFKEIDRESVEAGNYCRNLEALHLIKSIPVDIILTTNCLEDIALSSLCHSMLGLGGDSILRNQYLQPLNPTNLSDNNVATVVASGNSLFPENPFAPFIGRPFRDLTAKEIYLLARRENLIDINTDHSSINYLYQMEFLLDIGAKHPNSLINIAKLTEGSNLSNSINECIICKFKNNNNHESICSACVEISSVSKSAENFLHSLI